MEARELIIGNIYSLSLDNGIPEERALDSHDLLHILEYGKGDKVSPIPLTEEWLLKFGFECIHKNNQHYAIRLSTRGNHMIHFGPTTNDQWYLAFSSNYTGKDETHITETKIKYVHQLQNLFHSLTGTELTIL